jgi:hypothetical protein
VGGLDSLPTLIFSWSVALECSNLLPLASRFVAHSWRSGGQKMAIIYRKQQQPDGPNILILLP